MNAISCSTAEADAFLKQLTEISSTQARISEKLHRLLLLLSAPSEDPLRILQMLLLPMNQEIRHAVTLSLTSKPPSASKIS